MDMRACCSVFVLGQFLRTDLPPQFRPGLNLVLAKTVFVAGDLFLFCIARQGTGIYRYKGLQLVFASL